MGGWLFTIPPLWLGKAMARGYWRLVWIVIAASLAVLVVTQVAYLNLEGAQAVCLASGGGTSGFVLGLGHRFVVLICLPLSWFFDSVSIYQSGNGLAYDMGYGLAYAIGMVLSFVSGLLD